MISNVELASGNEPGAQGTTLRLRIGKSGLGILDKVFFLASVSSFFNRNTGPNSCAWPVGCTHLLAPWQGVLFPHYSQPSPPLHERGAGRPLLNALRIPQCLCGSAGPAHLPTAMQPGTVQSWMCQSTRGVTQLLSSASVFCKRSSNPPPPLWIPELLQRSCELQGGGKWGSVKTFLVH